MAPGSGTLQDDLILKVGGTNITHNLTDYANVSLEVIIDANPEAMIAGVGHGIEKDLNFQFIKTESRLRDTDARRNNRIYAVDGNLVSRPGPRIVDGLEELARLIHPEIFSSS
jgi:iron complex transport system substrate-binding protein